MDGPDPASVRGDCLGLTGKTFAWSSTNAGTPCPQPRFDHEARTICDRSSTPTSKGSHVAASPPPQWRSRARAEPPQVGQIVNRRILGKRVVACRGLCDVPRPVFLVQHPAPLAHGIVARHNIPRQLPCAPLSRDRGEPRFLCSGRSKALIRRVPLSRP